MEAIGTRIRTERTRRKWSMRTLAVIISYTENTIGSVERGEYPPSKRFLEAVETAFGMQLGELEKAWRIYGG